MCKQVHTLGSLVNWSCFQIFSAEQRPWYFLEILWRGAWWLTWAVNSLADLVLAVSVWNVSGHLCWMNTQSLVPSVGEWCYTKTISYFLADLQMRSAPYFSGEIHTSCGLAWETNCLCNVMSSCLDLQIELLLSCVHSGRQRFISGTLCCPKVFCLLLLGRWVGNSHSQSKKRLHR